MDKSGSVISVVLLPCQEDSRMLIQLSAAIGKAAPSAIELSATTLPHITIAQFFAQTSEAEQLWHEVVRYKESVSQLVSNGLAFVPSASRSETWVALDLMKSKAVAGLNEAVSATGFARTHKMNNGPVDMYWPHITLALIAGRQAVNVDLEDSNAFRRTYAHLTLAVGVNGPNFTFTNVLLS